MASKSKQFLTILFADLVGSTHLYQSEGDVKAYEIVSDSLNCMRLDIEKNSGKLLRTVGDAALASFEVTDNAFHAAVAMQRSHQTSSLSVRVGFHCGEVIPDAGDIYGNAVNLAARVAAYANADEIFTTEATVGCLSPALQSRAYFLDRIDFKGIEKPMPVYRVNWAEESAETTAIVSAESRTMRYRTNETLELTVGAKSVKVNAVNPLLKLGRSIENDVTVDHNSTSRTHARVEFVNGRYRFSDSSTNGSYIIRSGRNPEFVRRESTFLEDFGIIGLGWSPLPGEGHVIRFRLIGDS
ncbi:MAG: adenylate/guanylate cyclase domain-containing protein [Granulosicoccus sp.]